MKRYTLSCLLTLFLGSYVQAQEVLPDGYYTFSSLDNAAEGLTYTHDEDALRPVYGNATDYDHPTGRNGEMAYLYMQLGINTSKKQQIYYFKHKADGKYVIQSCSGNSHSYLDVAAYDRHLVCHSARPKHAFSLHPYDYTNSPQWGANTYMMQTYMQAAIFDSPAIEVSPLSGLSVLMPVEDKFLTPDIPLRQALSDAKGVLATYPTGNNPGQVPAMLAYTLNELVEEGDANVNKKDLTESQANDLINKLKEATKQYEAAAPASTFPVCEGYYFVTSAYRTFELRQNKQKAMSIKNEEEGNAALIWNSLNPNDGDMVMHLVPAEDSSFQVFSFDDRVLCCQDTLLSFEKNTTSTPFTFSPESFAMWTVSPQDQPDAFLTADNPAKGRTGLYGKNVSDAVILSRQGHLYTGYCASWYLQKAYHIVNVPGNGWAGLTTSFPVEIPENIQVYTVNEVDGQLHAIPYIESRLPAYAAVLVKAPKGTYTFTSCIPSVPLEPVNNLLKTCHTSVHGITAGTMALLKMENGEIGFAKSTQTSLQAGMVYLPYNSGEPDFRPLIVDEKPNGIDNIKTEEKDAPIFDLNGKPVHKPQKGIHIRNNKKILIR